MTDPARKEKQVSGEDHSRTADLAKPITEQFVGTGRAGLAGAAVALLGGGTALAFFAHRRNQRKLQAAENGAAAE